MLQMFSHNIPKAPGINCDYLYLLIAIEKMDFATLKEVEYKLFCLHGRQIISLWKSIYMYSQFSSSLSSR